MTLKKPISGRKYVEYTPENRNTTGTWGVMPNNPTLLWLGLVNEFTGTHKELHEESRNTGDSDETHTLELQRNTSVGAELTASLKYVMQDWDFIKYITGSEGGFSDTVDSISVVYYIDSEWRVLTGGILTKWNLTIPKFGIATVDTDILFCNRVALSNPTIQGTTIEVIVADGTSEKEEYLTTSHLCSNMLLDTLYFEVMQLATAGKTAKLELINERGNMIYCTGDLDASTAKTYSGFQLERGLMGQTTLKVTTDANVTGDKTFNVEMRGLELKAPTHALELSTAPYTWRGISALKMDAADPPITSFKDIVGDIGLTITNDVEMCKDVDSTYLTKGGGVLIKRRKIEVSLDLTYTSPNIATFQGLVANHTKQNLKFTLGAATITVKGLIFPEWVAELKPAQLVGQTVTGITDLPSMVISIT